MGSEMCIRDREGIFQLESSGMRQIVRDLKPSSLEDISSILALYRPGPLDAGLIPKFINRKHGREAIDFAHAILEPILSETYGIMVYQEQIMRIAQDLAGYCLGQADLLRRAMGKKKYLRCKSTAASSFRVLESAALMKRSPTNCSIRWFSSLNTASTRAIPRPMAPSRIRRLI